MWFLCSFYLVNLPLKEHLSCRQPLSARSEHNLNMAPVFNEGCKNPMSHDVCHVTQGRLQHGAKIWKTKRSFLIDRIELLIYICIYIIYMHVYICRGHI